MLGTDVRFVGSKQKLKGSYDTNCESDTFLGPSKFIYVNDGGIIELSHDAIYCHRLNGSILWAIYPEKDKDHIEAKKAAEAEDTALSADDWQLAFVSKPDENTIKTGVTATTPTYYFDILPTNICEVNTGSLLGIIDERDKIHLLDVNTVQIVNVFGRFGTLPGEFSVPTCCVGFKIGKNDSYYAVSESGNNHRVQILNSDFQHVSSVGGLGSMMNQFRNPTSVSTFVPSKYDDIEHFEFTYPHWYKGHMNIDDVIDILHSEEFALTGNFLCCKKDWTTKDYDLVHLTEDNTRQHWNIERDPAQTESVIITNITGENPISHPSVLSLVKSMKGYRFGDDIRDFMYVAVADRGNFRVQIFKFFWVPSEISGPCLELAHTIGGYNDAYRKLVDPVSVSYSKSGVLAISDAGARSVLLLSPTMELMKIIDTVPVTPLTINKSKVPGKSHRSTVQSRMSDRPGTSAGKSGFIVPTFPAEDPRSARLKKLTKSASAAALLNPKPIRVQFIPGKDYLAIGYQNGSVRTYAAPTRYQVGNLCNLQQSVLEKVLLEYLTYDEFINIRACCVCLHEFTRELRLAWKIFPLERQKYHGYIIYSFLRWAREPAASKYILDQGTGIGEELGSRPDETFGLKDKERRKICRRALECECEGALVGCDQSHDRIEYDRLELAALGLVVEYSDFMALASLLFGPKFLWKFEIYIKKLFDAYSKDVLLESRKGFSENAASAIKANKKKIVDAAVGVRRAVIESARVLYYKQYFELMTILEEQHDNVKGINTHGLFSTRGKTTELQKHHLLDWENIDKRVYIPEEEQYDKSGIKVPFKSIKGPVFKTIKGLEVVQSNELSPIKQHIAAYNHYADKIASSIGGLFK